MSILAEILSSHVRAEIFQILFDQKRSSYHLREIQRMTGKAVGTIQQELKKLNEMELVIPKRDGNRLYYSANTQHPLFSDICSLVEKTMGIIPLLQQTFAKEKITCAFVFGSIAKKQEKAASDVDIIIIGEVSLRKLSPLLRKVGNQLQREINPHLYTPLIWVNKMKVRDHFVTSVLREKRIFLIGDENVLKAMGE